jgi:lambda repressor-like predicted transcriptional regulator
VIHPYVRTTQRGKWSPRYQKYTSWKTGIRLIANIAGVPSELQRGSNYRVSVVLAWKRGARADIDNAGIKNVLDALWSQDRRVIAVCVRVIEFHGMDELKVTVEEL